MKQYVKLFTALDKKLDNLINDYLRENPSYSIDKVIFMQQSRDICHSDRALVVFNVNGSPSRIPEFENGKYMKDCAGCKIRDFCKDFGDGGVHTCQEVYQIFLQRKENI